MASDNFSRAHLFTARWEGGLSDHPSDKGGLTSHGVSLAFLKDLATTSTGKNLLQSLCIRVPVTRASVAGITREKAAALFRHEFWDRLKCDQLPFRQAAMLYDAAVNCGCKQALKFSQRGYNNCVNYGSKLAVDGLMGPLTRRALSQDTPALVRAILQCRRDFYEQLAQSKPSQAVFLKGWLNRVNDLEKNALGPWA